jgi:hypothetical protein
VESLQAIREKMKKLADYIAESESPVTGDRFAINIREECLIESHVVDVVEDGIVIEGDERLLALLEEYGFQLETIRRYGAVGSSPGMGFTTAESDVNDAGSDNRELQLIRRRAGLDETAPDQPETNAAHNDPLAAKAADLAPVGADSSAGRTATIDEDGVDPVNAAGKDAEELQGNMTAEAKYQGREVKLGKKMAGDVKKSKVYVRGPKGNVVKVNFGDPNMTIKKSNPARRKSFRARHNCDNPGPRWKARYWSCRSW